MAALPARSVSTLNNGHVVSVVGWSLTAAALLCAGLKLFLAKISIGLSWDDGFILAALAFGVAQTSVTSIQSMNGVGRHAQTLQQGQLQLYEKTGYAAELLFVLVLVCAKLSTVAFALIVSPRPYDRAASISIGVFVIVWSLASFLVLAFQCPLPDVWHILEERCIDQTSFWIVFSSINIATEAALIALPSAIVINSRVDRQTKMMMVTGFNARILNIAAIVAQIVFLRRNASSTGAASTFTAWPTVLCFNLVQSVTIITVCIPYIKGMLIGMESGMLQIGHIRHRQYRQMSRAVFTSSEKRRRTDSPGVLAQNSIQQFQLLPIAVPRSHESGEISDM